MKKANFILSLVAVALFIVQLVFMCMPFCSYTPKPTLAQRLGDEPMPEPLNVSLASYVSVDYSAFSVHIIQTILAEEEAAIKAGTMTEEDRTMPPSTSSKIQTSVTEDQKDALGDMSNDHVMGIVIPLVCGLVMSVMTIFTRKSWVCFMFSVIWAFSGLISFLNPNYVMLMGSDFALNTILPVLKYSFIASAIVVVARAVPWVFTRWMPYKLPLKINKNEKNWYVA